MYTHLDCIALRTTRLNDSKNLLTAWSRQNGRITLSMASGGTPEARRRRALTAPLCTFEGECNIRPDKEIYSMRDFRASANSLAMNVHPQKQLIAIFLGEVLDLLLRRNDSDETLSNFLFSSIASFSAMTDRRAIANFYIIFLYKLTYVAGIGPRLDDWHRNAIFDMRDACFRNTMPLHHDFLRGPQCTTLMAISRANYNTCYRLPLNSEGRRQALDTIIAYYGLHLASLQSLHSLEILREMAV